MCRVRHRPSVLHIVSIIATRVRRVVVCLVSVSELLYVVIVVIVASRMVLIIQSRLGIAFAARPIRRPRTELSLLMPFPFPVSRAVCLPLSWDEFVGVG